MSKRLWIVAAFAASTAVGWPLLNVAGAQEVLEAAPAQNLRDAAAPRVGLPQLTPASNGHGVHIFPTVQGATALARARLAPTPLIYHSGGAIMPTATFYAIFWIPPKLQNGGATSLPVAYQNLQTRLLMDYPAHGIDNINTQYYQIIGTQSFIGNAGGFGESYVDTAPYPASGCTDSYTPGNCITDAQIEAEIKRVMALKGWTGGSNKMFLLYTSSGEGSCFDSTNKSCAYRQYCAYHSFIAGSPNIVYANMPFGNPATCQVPGTPSPNGNAAADTTLTAASHEMSEAITDPLLNAWFTAGGSENGDLCAYNYGSNTWDAGKANQSWSGHFYELQQEFNNHVLACGQVGP